MLLHTAVRVELGLIHIFLCVLCNLGHQSNSFDRVLAYSCLAGEHDRIGTVVDGICNVSDLCTGRAGIADHGIQHLSRGNDRLISFVALADDLLLNMRYKVGRNLNAEVTAGDHDSV